MVGGLGGLGGCDARGRFCGRRGKGGGCGEVVVGWMGGSGLRVHVGLEVWE